MMKPRQIMKVVVEEVVVAGIICGLLLTWLLGPDVFLDAMQTTGLLTYIGVVAIVAAAIWLIEKRE